MELYLILLHFYTPLYYPIKGRVVKCVKKKEKRKRKRALVLNKGAGPSRNAWPPAPRPQPRRRPSAEPRSPSQTPPIPPPRLQTFLERFEELKHTATILPKELNANPFSGKKNPRPALRCACVPGVTACFGGLHTTSWTSVLAVLLGVCMLQKKGCMLHSGRQ